MKELLLATKFRVPRLPVQHVPRPRLVTLLERGVVGSLTLVSAPAGSGKTTLLTEWARATPLLVAWLALESADSEPARLLAYLQASLQALDERVGQQISVLPDFPSSSDYEQALSVLINDLIHYVPGDAVLVLDDYHTLEGDGAHTLLTFWLEHAPEHIHLVLGTRVDPPLPLARLRARGHLSEIHADTLRFVAEEVEAFLRAMDLELGENALSRLEQRTEGWIAGVQLAALALRGRPDPETFLSSFRGNHRFVLEYMSEEILARQTPPVRAFLLQTSILERLSSSLCDAVMEQGGGQAMLEALRRANLFVSALDETGEWYRYHALFAESLRHQLVRQESEERITHLYARASAWFEAHDMFYEACDYALRARDFFRAVPLMERLVNKMIGRVEFSMLRHWLAQVPEEIIAERPLLRVAATWVLLTNDETHDEKLEHTITSFQQSFQENANKTNYAEWAEAQANLTVIRIMQELGKNHTQEALELARQTLQILPENATYMRGLVQLCIRLIHGVAYRLSGNFVAAEQILLEASAHVQDTDFHFLHLVALVSLIEMYEARGELRKIARLYQQLFQMMRANKEALPEMTIWVSAGYARLLLEWNRLDKADEYIQMAQAASRNVEITELTLSYRFIQLWISHLQGRHQEVQALLRDINDASHSSPHAASDLEMLAQVRLLLDKGQVDEAACRVRVSGVRYNDSWSEPPDENVFARYISQARVLIAQARRSPLENHLAQALSLLERLRISYENAGFLGRVVEILMLIAQALQLQGEMPRALESLARAIALAEPGGFVRLFVDEGEPMARMLAKLLVQKPPTAPYIHTLLAAMPANTCTQIEASRSIAPGGTSSLSESLSAREMEVLALLATGSSNQEIAARLVIAPNTAKRHVKNILGKLAANNRTQAVAFAREAGLLEHI